MKITSSIAFMPTKDLNAVKHFYVDILKLSIHHETNQSIIIDTHYGYWGFVDYGPQKALTENICLSLNCASMKDVDAFYEQLNKDFQIEVPPSRHKTFPVYSFFMKDPNGYTLEFQIIL